MPATHRLLIQVLPRLTPGRCGVSDQAVLLARALEDDFAIDPTFVVMNSKESSGLSYPVLYCAPGQLLERCRQLTGNQLGAMLVHLSGYGYSADGAPALLADALAAVRKTGQFRTAVYFHELFATGMPWRKAFWFSRRQRRAVRKIAEDADLLITNTRHHAAWLETEPKRRSKYPVQLLPVVSAAGEALEPVPVAARDPILAVFGLPGSRRRAYNELSELVAMLQALAIREIFDIGAEFDAPPDLGGIPVRRLGIQTQGDLVALFSRVTFGFVPHPPHCLAKSSIFASFCARGTIPVLAASFPGEVDGLQDGIHVVSPRTALTQSGFEACSQAAWRWYWAHRVSVHAGFYARWLEAEAVNRGADPYIAAVSGVPST